MLSDGQVFNLICAQALDKDSLVLLKSLTLNFFKYLAVWNKSSEV